MSFLEKVARAKKLLVLAKRLPGDLEVKYGNLTAEKAWDLFFSLFILRFTHIHSVTADTVHDTKPKQVKILSDIYLFLHDAVEKFSQTALEYNYVAGKYGTDEFIPCFKKHYADVLQRIFDLKSGAQHCRSLAFRHQIAQQDLYKKYETYLQEILGLTPERLHKNFAQNKFPLEDFDEKCNEQEGDPLSSLNN